MKTAIVIPARYGATRLPGKLLLAQTGKTLLQHSWEAACRVTGVDRVLIAADDDRIKTAAEGFGARVVMTRTDHPTGSNRVAEAASTLDADLIINLQGDEPEIDPQAVDHLISVATHSDCFAATLACPFPDPAATGQGSPADPNAVKVVFGAATGDPKCGRPALYFSRAPVPHGGPYFLHLGLYAFRAASLQRFAGMPPGALEKAEKLEQLRILESGEAIAVGLVEKQAPGIDTQADYNAFVARHSGNAR
ncbi:MAG: 3-deoxy-manno-octulosonate cytidylyltransferase [Pseudomonadota bacterium]